jgi:tight adherence protein B
MLLPLFFGLLLISISAFFVLAARPSARQRLVQARIADIRNPRRSIDIDAAMLDMPSTSSFSRQLGNYMNHYSATRKLERLLLEADSSTTVGSLALTSLSGSGAAGLAALLVSRSVPFCLAGAAMGVVFPVARLHWKRKRRLKAVTAGLPDAADLMSRALRSGHSMTQTIELAGEQAPQPLGAEFGRVFQQQKLGIPLRDVLVELGERLPSRDLQFLLTAILVQRETGGDLAAVLDRTAQVLRERIQLQAQVQIHTAQGRLTGWILSLMPVVLLAAMMLFSPHYAHSLFDDPLGRKLLYAGAGFILTGGLIIRKIVGVRV